MVGMPTDVPQLAGMATDVPQLVGHVYRCASACQACLQMCPSMFGLPTDVPALPWGCPDST